MWPPCLVWTRICLPRRKFGVIHQYSDICAELAWIMELRFKSSRFKPLQKSLHQTEACGCGRCPEVWPGVLPLPPPGGGATFSPKESPKANAKRQDPLREESKQARGWTRRRAQAPKAMQFRRQCTRTDWLGMTRRQGPR